MSSMRKAVFSTLKFVKWRCLVPAFWHLGLPHDWLAERLRLAGVLTGPTEETFAESAPDAEGAAVGAAPSRGSIYAPGVVADALRVLRKSEGRAAAERFLDTLIAQAPQYEVDIRWGEMLALRDDQPRAALDAALALYDRYPAIRFSRALLRMLNQSGEIRSARKLAERFATDDPSVARTLSLLRAREDMLQHGFALPERAEPTSFQPNSRRVFYLLHNSLPYNSGGYATRTHGLVRSLRTRGWDVECVTRLGYPVDVDQSTKWVPPIDHIDDVPYHRLKDPKGAYRTADAKAYMTLNAEAVLRMARKRHPAILHGVSNHINGIAAAYVGRKLDIPSVYEVRGLWELTRISRQPEFEGSELFEMIVKLETQACLAVDRVVAITEALKDLLIDRGVPASKIRVVPNGVDVARFETHDDADWRVRSTWAIPDSAMVIGYVGSMPQYEGLDDLIQAIARLPEDIRQSVHCLLVGDGDQLSALRGLTAQLRLVDRIHFVGRVPHEEVERYYAAIDVLVFPRKPQPVTEAVSPIKPFEAMAMGKAVVASNVAALAEIIQDGKTGLLFEKGDTVDLGRCIARLVQNRELLSQFGREGRSWVRSNRDWQGLSSALVEDYEELVHADSLRRAHRRTDA